MLPLLLSVLLGCPSAVVPDDTGTVDTSDVVPVSDWCAPTLSYRLRVDVRGPAETPVEVPIDLGAQLAAEGDVSGLHTGSLRAFARVAGFCEPLPAQFLDGFSGILDKRPSADPLGDGAGSVVVLRDGLRDEELEVHLYFDSGATAGNDEPVVEAPPLSATATRLETGGTVATFDFTRGGLLWQLTYDNSPSLASLTESEYGNGISTGRDDASWQIDAQDGPGNLELLADGPVVAGVRASGERSDDLGGYVYDHEYWVFAGRRELYTKVHQVTDRSTTMQHRDDFTHGMRPFQARHTWLVNHGIEERVKGPHHAWLAGDEWGVGYGFVHPPAYSVYTLNDDVDDRPRYFVSFWGNDYLPEGLGTPHVVPESVTHFAWDVLAAVPFHADDGVRDLLFDIMDRPETTAGELERLGDTQPWWDEQWPYRLPVRVEGEHTDGLPVFVRWDHAATLSALGDDSALEVDSLRLVAFDADGNEVEVPVQLLDTHGDLLADETVGDPSGDGVGTLAFVPEGIGDGGMHLNLYFASQDRSVGQAPQSSATATATTLAAGEIEATFDESRGGLLDKLQLEDSPVLTSQAASDFGNGLNGAGDPWSIVPQTAPGTLEVLSSGPVVAGVRTTGTRSDADTAYFYRYDYWAFAGSPALWVRIHLVTTSASTESHADDFTLGIRPFYARQDWIVDNGDETRRSADDRSWALVENDAWGMAAGWLHAPEHLVRVHNDDSPGFGERHYFLGWSANDYLAEGSGTPHTIPGGTKVVDEALLVLAPYDVLATDGEANLMRLLTRPTATLGDAQEQ